MKIALIRKQYTPFGGAERFVQHLAGSLSAKGHEIHILAHSWEPVSSEPSPKLRLKRIPLGSGPYWFQALQFAGRVKKAVASEPFDVVHSFERTYSQDVYRAGDGCHREYLRQRARFAPAWKRASFPLNPHHRVTLWLERKTFTGNPGQLVMANSERGREEIVNHYGILKEKIKVIYNALWSWPERPLVPEPGDRERLERLGLPQNVKKLLFLGSGFKRKGLGFIINSLNSLKNKDLVLLVVGKDTPGPYQNLSRRSGLKGRVFFLGPQSDTGVFYRAAHAFILPSIYEPFSNACLEAVSYGLPVVTSRINGTAEILEPGVNGYIVDDPSDNEALAAAISGALELDRARIFSHNRDKWKELFSPGRITGEVENLYDQALQLKGTARG